MIKSGLIIFFLLFGTIACAEGAKYTREECIVRINIDWGDASLNSKEATIRTITDAIRKAPDMGFNKTPASSAIQGNAREFIYYQYKDDCENRIENTKKLLRYVRDNITDLPPLEVDSGSFRPGVDTIRSSGPWWKDRETPVGERVIIDDKEYIEVE
ncbi:hypothetical protein MA04_02734 [Alcanivorax balearicus MACL04]|uniref:Uncharacterized protein n=1 Tax=Alloalcanivorax balearicus MACL04 TaxID=1177182 RepID=A0ABT2R0Y6_9GAMM|nr:hypothetical protein [Alloalcanivorax balearicus]MCU5783434.1 hypothetical protein [Alloalcanivorax balearicus MACL04]